MEVPEYKNTFLLQSWNTKFLFSKIRANETNTKEFSFYALRFVFKKMVLFDSSIPTPWFDWSAHFENPWKTDEIDKKGLRFLAEKGIFFQNRDDL